MDVAVIMQERFWCRHRDCWGEEEGSWKRKEESRAEKSKAYLSSEHGTATPSVCTSHPGTSGISQSTRPARAGIPGLPCPPGPTLTGMAPRCLQWLTISRELVQDGPAGPHNPSCIFGSDERL